MNSQLSLAAEKTRKTFLAHYALSVFLPILIMIFVVFQYVIPLLSAVQLEQLRNIFVYGLASMIIIPFLSFFLMLGWVRIFESLAEDVKSKSAELFPGERIADEKNEVKTLHNIFDTLHKELEGKIGQLNEYSKKLIESNAKLSELSIKDELTTLYNRRHFDTRLQEEINRANRYERSLSLIMIDIDDFKGYNDSYGHPAGDKALTDLGHLIRHSIRNSDIPFRYGGDEFAIICPECESDCANAIAEKLSEIVAMHPFTNTSDEAPRKITLSCGVASYSKDMATLVDEADVNLYKAKRNGKANTIASE